MPYSYSVVNRMLGLMLASAKRKYTATLKKHPYKKTCKTKCTAARHFFDHWTRALLLGHIEALQNVKNNLNETV